MFACAGVEFVIEVLCWGLQPQGELTILHVYAECTSHVHRRKVENLIEVRKTQVFHEE